MAGFRFSVFDPLLIVLQIGALQCLFYTMLASLLSATAHHVDVHLELRLVLSAEVLPLLQVMPAYMATALFCAGFLFVLVGRAKQCLDFAATVYILHFVISAAAFGIPGSFGWYVLNCACLAVMAIVGEYLCMHFDVGAIQVASGINSSSGGGSSSSNSSSSSSGASSSKATSKNVVSGGSAGSPRLPATPSKISPKPPRP